MAHTTKKALEAELKMANEKLAKNEKTIEELTVMVKGKEKKPFSITIEGDKADGRMAIGLNSTGLTKQELVFALKIAIVNAEEDVRTA